VAAYLVVGRRPSPAPAAPPPTTLSPAAAAALARVQELEQRLAELEREREAAQAAAVDEARAEMEQQAAARGRAVDPAALERTEAEARRRAREEQERRQQHELRRLAEEKRAEEERLAEERRRAEQARAAPPAATAPTPLVEPLARVLSPPEPGLVPVDTTSTTTTLPAVQAGALLSLSDPGVTPPRLDRQERLVYPQIALRQRVEGTVELNVLIDEDGQVADVQVVQGAGGRAGILGLNEAAVENIRRRRYQPATKDGVPVKVWLPVRVVFELSRQ
jgi:TonB family protein